MNKEAVFLFLNKNPEILKEYLMMKSETNPQKRMADLSLKEIHEARNKNLPFNFIETDIIIPGKKTIIGIETSLDCPILCKNNFNEVKKFALKNDIGVGLILSKSKNKKLELYTLSAMNLYPDKKLLIIDLVINNPNQPLENLSKMIKIDHLATINNIKNIDIILKETTPTPLIYINTLTIKGIYRQEAINEVFKLLY
jgi:hypothetical protein